MTDHFALIHEAATSAGAAFKIQRTTIGVQAAEIQRLKEELEEQPATPPPTVIVPHNCLPQPARVLGNAVYISGHTTGRRLPFDFTHIIKHVNDTAHQFGFDLARTEYIILDVEHVYRTQPVPALLYLVAQLIWDLKCWWREHYRFTPSIGIWGAPGMGMTWQGEIEPDEIAEHIDRDGQVLAASDFLCPAQYLRMDMSLNRWKELAKHKLDMCKAIAPMKSIYFCMCPFFENYSYVGNPDWAAFSRFVLDNGATGITLWANRDESQWPDDSKAFVEARIGA